jgi:hypothetical protein
VLQALAVAGRGPALAKGVDYLRASQHKGGGFALAFNGPVNSQSTAWAVQGLLAAGVNPGSLRRGGTPLSYLAKVRAVDGHYRYSSSSDQTPVWVTGQVLTAVDGKPYPIAAVPRAPAPSSGGSAATPAPTGGTFPGKAAAPGAVSPAPTGGSQAPAPSTANGLTGSTPSADSKARDDDSGPSAVLITAGGIAAACALAAGGWFLYRRRLA